MAGSRELNSYAIRMLTDEAELRRTLLCPVLVWESGADEQVDPLLLATDPGQPVLRARAGKPLVFEVKKIEKNAFAQGITIGRTLNNDIAIADPSVSRFHGYLAGPPAKQTWELFDADSKVGTYIDGKRIPGKHATPISDRGRVRIGHVELVFFEAKTFIAWMREVSAKKK